MDQKKVSSRGKYSDTQIPTELELVNMQQKMVLQEFAAPWKRRIPEFSVRPFKAEYLKKLSELKDDRVTSLPTKPRGRPLLIGAELDKAIQDYLKALRSAGVVVNTAIVLAAAEGIISARYQVDGRLQKQGGDLNISKDWAKSLMTRMGFVKRKASNAGKILVSQFQELKEQYLPDIAAEVIMNDIPHDLIINWDQTGLKIIPTGDWTMNLSGG